jgi:hypothetical protein
MSKTTDRKIFLPSDLIGSVKPKKGFEPATVSKEVVILDLYVDINSVENPDGYQREPELDRAREIAEEFKISSMRPPIISKRKGTNKIFIVDGVHTSYANLYIGQEKIQARMVTEPTTVEEEARLFLYFNENTKSVSRLLKLRNRFNLKDPEILAINKIIEKNGFKAAWRNGTKKDNTFDCVVALEKLYNNDNGKHLDNILHFMKITWLDDENHVADSEHIVKANFLKGLSDFFIDHKPNLIGDNFSKFSEKCKKNRAATISDKASRAYGKYDDIFKEIYNSGSPKNKIT